MRVHERTHERRKLLRPRREADMPRLLEASVRCAWNQSEILQRLIDRHDAIERAIAVASTIRWIPPPVHGRYCGFRLTVGSSGRQVLDEK